MGKAPGLDEVPVECLKKGRMVHGSSVFCKASV